MSILSYRDSNNALVPISGSLTDDFYITHEQNGLDYLTFFVDEDLPLYQQLDEETIIEYDDNDYVIKKIQNDKFEAKLNLDFLKATMHLGKYSTGSKTLAQQLRTILGENWTVEFFCGSITYRRTVNAENCTDYDLINQFMSTYSCYFQWKTLKKTVIVHKKENEEPSGKYLTNELNLRSLSFQGDTTDLATVIYPRGKDGTGIVGASVNLDMINKYGLEEGVHYDSNGKYLLDYVECFGYTTKRIATAWSDERYTVKENLLADALAKVFDSGYPNRTYECDVINLAKQNPDYAFLDMRMHLVLTLIDTRKSLNVNHRVVQYVEYPDNHYNDKIVLSKVPSDINTSINALATTTADSINKSITALEAAIIRATSAITGNQGGYVVLYDSNNDGYPDEILVMDQPDISTAVNVWRWNKEGLAHSSTGYTGPYTTAITAAGEIVADFITAGHIDGALITAGTIEVTALSLEYRTSLAQQFLDLADEIESGDQDTYDTVHQELVAQNGTLTSMIQGFNTIESESMTLETENFDVITNWVFSGSSGSNTIDANENLKVSKTGSGNYYAIMKIEISDEIKLRFSQPYYYSVTLYATEDCTVTPAECRTVSNSDRCRSIPSSEIVESVGLNADNKIELLAGESKTVIIKMNLPSNPVGVGLRFEDSEGIDFYITKITLIAKSDIKETFSKITQKVGEISSEVVYNNELGTKITQNYNSVRIAWNQNSQYVAFEGGKLNIYDSFDSTHQLKASFDYNGSHFFHKNNNDEIGKIGTNHWTGNDNYKGLVFDLEANSSYMCWAARESSGGNYEVKLAYYHKTRTGRKKGLYLECSTYANGNLYLDDNYNIAKISNGHVCYAGGFYFGTRAANNNGGYDYTDYVGFSGRNFTVYNGASVNFYSNINMHNFNITGQSDIRIKKNVASTQINGLSVLNSLDMKEFEWCDTDEYVPIGIIAQQLNEVAPELIDTATSGLMSIKTSSLVYYAIKAIQELSEQVEELQAGTYTGTTYTKAPLDLTKAGTWNKAGDPVGAETNEEEIPESVLLPPESSEDDNENSEEEEE